MEYNIMRRFIIRSVHNSIVQWWWWDSLAVN